MADPKDVDRERPDLEIQPRPIRAIRLRTASLWAVGILAMVVLWAAYYVLSRTPRTRRAIGESRRGALNVEPDLDRLERRAQSGTRRPPEAPTRRPPMLSPRPLPPPPTTTVRPAPSRSVGAASPALQRLLRAYEAEPVLAAFSNPSPHRGSPPGAARAASQALPELPSRFIDALRSVPDSGPELLPDAEPKPILQDDDFLARARERSSGQLSARVEPLTSPFTLQQGTYLPAVLTAGIHSDLPGQTAALVRHNVFDSVTGRHLLIPQGTRLIGVYDNRIAWGQKRVLVAWRRLIFPDGRSLDLEGMPGADLAGMAGVRDQVDNHFVRTFGGALLLSAFSAGAQLSQPQESSNFGNAGSPRQVVAAALGQEINRTASQMLRRNLDVQPSLLLRPGKLFVVELTADVELPGPYRGETS